MGLNSLADHTVEFLKSCTRSGERTSIIKTLEPPYRRLSKTDNKKEGVKNMKWESYSHPISDIRDWDNNNRLELKPDFQRNEVWSRAAQIMLMDTIIKGIPIPKIYIKSVMHNGNI